MLHVGRVERVVRDLPARRAPVDHGRDCASRCRSGSCSSSSRSSSARTNGLGYYLVIQQSEFDVPELYAGILFLGLLGYVLNRLFLVAERRLLALALRSRR